jgi:aspartyl-tRNA(Asn)/glutamyl-tRNA(Gln) amidotransferase subunit C
MVLDENTIEKIAHLSRLQINNEDVPLYARNLSNILDFVGQMNAVDTADVEPMAHPLSVSQRLRADQVTEVNQRDKFQAIAPRVDSGLYLVPKVIE